MDLKKYLPFTLFFIVLFVLNLLFFDVLTQYRVVAKPMIMASLIGFYIAFVQKQDNIFIVAMIFALLGDIFLLFESEQMFMVGLGCFLLMQILYAMTFKKHATSYAFPILFLPLVLGSMVIFGKLLPNLGSLQIPVIGYAVAILTMAYFGFNRDKTLPGYWLITTGVVFFVISDLALAWAKFKAPFAWHEHVVIVTYMIAQYLIIRGMVEYHQASEEV
jgi:uncharacterized membrane protein YhhN